jgi:hypothetical protein
VVAELEKLLLKNEGESGFRALKSFFNDEKEIDMLKSNNKFKLSIRNILGLPKTSISTIGKPASRSPHERDP